MYPFEQDFEVYEAAHTGRVDAVNRCRDISDKALDILRHLTKDIDNQLMAERSTDPLRFERTHPRSQLDEELSTKLAIYPQLPISIMVSLSGLCGAMYSTSSTIAVWSLEKHFDYFNSSLEDLSQTLAGKDATETYSEAALARDMKSAIQSASEAENEVTKFAEDSSTALLGSITILKAFRFSHLSVKPTEAVSRLCKEISDLANNELDDVRDNELQELLIEIVGEELAEFVQINRLRRWLWELPRRAVGIKELNRTTNDTDLLMELLHLLDQKTAEIADLEKRIDVLGEEIRSIVSRLTDSKGGAQDSNG